jgi:hypothetical protein
MKHISRRTLIRSTGFALALPLLEPMVPAQAPLARAATTPKSRSAAVAVPRTKYRRVLPHPHISPFRTAVVVVEDEVGVRYGISKDKEEVLRYGVHFVGPPLRWMTLKPFKGAFATTMIAEIMAPIKEFEQVE